MNLPQELLEEILSHLPLEDEQGKQSLQKHSLVAKSWVNPTQRRLFETVELQDKTLNLWLANIPSTNEELLRHVRSLAYTVCVMEPRFLFLFFLKSAF